MFVTVGKASEIEDGEVTAFDVEGQTIAVANLGGRFYAFDDECTHEGCSLADGDVADNAVTCPCHGSQFDVTTGAVLTGPAEVPVSTYPLQVVDDDLKIEI